MINLKELNNKIDGAINKASFLKIYLITFLILSVFIFLLFAILFPFLLTLEDIKKIDFLVQIKISVILSAILSTMITLVLQMSKMSDKFWENAKELSKMVDDAESKVELDDIYKNKFQQTNKLSSGRPHYTEMERIYAIMKTKYKYVK